MGLLLTIGKKVTFLKGSVTLTLTLTFIHLLVLFNL